MVIATTPNPRRRVRRKSCALFVAGGDKFQARLLRARHPADDEVTWDTKEVVSAGGKQAIDEVLADGRFHGEGALIVMLIVNLKAIGQLIGSHSMGVHPNCQSVVGSMVSMRVGFSLNNA